MLEPLYEERRVQGQEQPSPGSVLARGYWSRWKLLPRHQVHTRELPLVCLETQAMDAEEVKGHLPLQALSGGEFRVW